MSSIERFFPQEVYVENAAADLPRTQAILEKIPDAKVTHIDDHRRIRPSPEPNADRFVSAKRRLALAVRKGEPVKEFRRHSCLRQAREYYLLHAAGCPYDCSYCYLQSYFENPVPTIFVNAGELFDRIETIMKKESQTAEGVLFHAGETADALALEHLSGFAADAVPFFAQLDGAVLELRTKSDNVESILPLSHAGRTIASWTLTPQKIAEGYEGGAATIEERLGAASRCADAGYPIGLRLDPMIHYDGWQEGYRTLVEQISGSLSLSQIHSIVLGAFRFPSRLREIMIERFGRNELVLAEFVPSPDGKYRYFRHIREQMYREIASLFRDRFGETISPKIELAMEPEYVWRNVGIKNDTSLCE
jgi:spore photoproduct lyase